jgi:hypothetical protein
MVKSKKMNLVEALVATPNLSSALYILYWNLDLNAKALRELGDLRLLVQKEEARINEQEKVDDYYVKGEEVLSPFGDGNWDANIIHNDG